METQRPNCVTDEKDTQYIGDVQARSVSGIEQMIDNAKKRDNTMEHEPCGTDGAGEVIESLSPQTSANYLTNAVVVPVGNQVMDRLQPHDFGIAFALICSRCTGMPNMAMR